MPANGPEDVDATFAQIAAELEREGLDTAWPDEPSKPTPWHVVDQDYDWTLSSDTEHYVPAEPPPLPTLSLGTLAALALMAVGIVLLAVPALAGIDNPVTTPIALLTLTGGACWLVLRMRHEPPQHPSDDGAQI